MPRDVRDYDKDLKAVGNKVAIRKMEKYHDFRIGGIIIPETTDINSRMTKGEIMSIGSEAVEKTAMQPGDIVLYDTMSSFYDHHPVIVTNSENIVCKFRSKEDGVKY